MLMMRELSHQVGRFNLCRLMKVAGRTSRQPGDHAYKVARAERPDIPNLLAREFVVPQLNQVWCGVVWCGVVWCGDITYVWAGGRWHYLAAVLDLHIRRVVGWSMSDRPDADLAVNGYFGYGSIV